MSNDANKHMGSERVIYGPRHNKICFPGIPTRCDKNRIDHVQKIKRGLRCDYLRSEYQGAVLRLCFAYA